MEVFSEDDGQITRRQPVPRHRDARPSPPRPDALPRTTARACRSWATDEAQGKRGHKLSSLCRAEARAQLDQPGVALPHNGYFRLKLWRWPVVCAVAWVPAGIAGQLLQWRGSGRLTHCWGGGASGHGRSVS